MHRKSCFLSSMVLFVLLSILVSIPVRASLIGWSQNYGGTDGDYATSVVETSDGGYALAGYTGPFGAGIDDFLLIKTDSLGKLEWNQTYGGTSIDRACSVVETSDGGYAILGETLSFGAGMGDFWLIKTDANGNMQWSKLYGGTDRDAAQSLVETSDGGYALAGYTYSYGAGSNDAWLVKTDELGNMEWNRTYGTADRDIASSLVQTSDGGYAIAGQTYSFGAGEGDFWLVKTDGSGNIEWSQTYGGTGTEGIFVSLVQTADAGYAIAGDFGSDYWLVKTNSAGKLQWNQTYGGRLSDTARSLVQTSDGGYALAGETRSFGAGIGDAWLVKTDASGNMEWNHTYGGPMSELAASLIETSDGGYALAGETGSFSAGHIDAWLVKTDEQGKLPEHHVRIKADGTVEGTDKIQQNGNFYTFTENIFVDDFSVEKNNIIVDGNGYALSGSGVHGSGTGFDLTNRINVTIQNMNIHHFTTGILLNCSFYCNVTGNTVINNAEGIHAISSYDNIISGNDITSNNWIGIYFGGSHNIISGNIIIDNNVGMYFYKQSSNNTIYSNDFVNNDLQISIDPELEQNVIVNAWDNGAEGNYWNDYNGTDTDGDGIGDTPYILDENNQDNYPLMEPNIIPEFPSWIILPLFIAATLTTLIYRKKHTNRKQNNV
jgi:parallel beta-helix repeat protein